MRNIIEIPQNAKNVLVIIRTTEDDVHCLPINATSRFKAMTMLLGSFTQVVKDVEETDCAEQEENLTCAEYVRSLLKDLELEDVVEKLVDIMKCGESTEL
jgi:hypothetical protein